MKFLPLLWATLWRKKVRTVLTLLSLMVAFLLLGLLQGANSLFNGATINLSAPILISQARVSFTSPLPLSLMSRMQAVPGVTAVSHSQFFGGYYQDPKNFFAQFATVPDEWMAVFQECALPPEQAKAWKETRTGAVIGQRLVQQFGWKIGDRVPLKSTIWPMKDGSHDWTFDIVGILQDRTPGSCPRMGNMYFRYDYLDETRQFGQGLAGIYALRIANPDNAEAIASQVDAMFENSPDETKTQTERDFTLNFARQVGNLSLILHWILFAVFFSILMLTGNTMRQSIAERIPELAVMKTLGFTDSGVLLLVLAESLLLCLLGGLTGMGLANLAMKVMSHLPNFPPLAADASVWGFAVGAMLLLALLVGALPALRAQRLSIVDALAGR